MGYLTQHAQQCLCGVVGICPTHSCEDRTQKRASLLLQSQHVPVCMDYIESMLFTNAVHIRTEKGPSANGLVGSNEAPANTPVLGSLARLPTLTDLTPTESRPTH